MLKNKIKKNTHSSHMTTIKKIILKDKIKIKKKITKSKTYTKVQASESEI
jgi:hypothetical protein